MDLSKKIMGICLVLFFLLGMNIQNIMAQDIDCEDCHDPLPKSSVHYDAAECYECHTDIKDEDHEDQRIRKVNCTACHEEKAESVDHDIHHHLKDKVKNPPTCKSCHSTHDVKSPDQVKDKVKTYCSQCHDQNRLNYTYTYHTPFIPNSECLDCYFASI